MDRFFRNYEYELQRLSELQQAHDREHQALKEKEEQLIELTAQNRALQAEIKHLKRNSLISWGLSVLALVLTGVGINFLSSVAASEGEVTLLMAAGGILIIAGIIIEGFAFVARG